MFHIAKKFWFVVWQANLKLQKFVCYTLHVTLPAMPVNSTETVK